MARRAGIKDVAALAGVSPATVSRALNENLSTLVAPGTRARVQAAAESLEYSANPLAVGMQK
ncbi:MAG TPA: LacI family DNA-binding transcriptional regulator, partial [Nakamurella sp.]